MCYLAKAVGSVNVVQVEAVNVDLAREDPVAGSATDCVMVTLHLILVGCQVYNMTPQRVLQLVECMLTTLIAIHEAGFVHRDVREDNIIEAQSGFCLIDWELAGRNDEIVFWTGPSLPSDVKLKQGPFVYQDDLWQLGVTLSRIATSTGPLLVYVRTLMDGGFATARAALSTLQELKS